MIVLVHRLPSTGEPVGVWSEQAHLYDPDSYQYEQVGDAIMSDRRRDRSWDDWVEDLVRRTPYTILWTSEDEKDDASLIDVLSRLRTEYAESD